ncbi:LVIVD repeat-containing protein [Chitinophaga ginsengisegetis]|uniref:LVIVD repeat-containing protein n=1 Tax=Chitinophaga ginsengisegetis TaxID=393003 RepID=UPI000DB969C9|nr:hypothetical protein [Chitinophaga ginsengisegetis]MDR6568974.1 hypothetical protein [Chitinophaga ginsengisegetis]MDR6648997.1 hypothetical protein [Chitinophaga ginsengisegetis]MDR6655055.1 hypothetical protein [Chitinophaga ginsengisegetis]
MHISTYIKFPVIIAAILVLGGCTKEKCTKTITTKIHTPILMALSDYQASIKSEAPKEISHTGKIYVKDQYIFVNEPYAGIHVIDNSNPSSPQKVSFLNVMGNVDIAIKGNFLYADSYTDLIVFNISDPRNIAFVKRIPEATSYPTDANGMIVGWRLKQDSMVIGYTVKDTTYCDCSSDRDMIYFASAEVAASYKNQAGTGKGGSMARFTIAKNYLYTVNSWQLKAFDLTDAANPAFKSLQTFNTFIETIFPYGEYLFIGSQSAMFIYDITNPAAPAKRSMVTHFRACDPVVVEGNRAYVTIRSGAICAGNINQLQIFDISNVDSPVKLSTTEMQNPHGLGIDNGKLFVCEGQFGLRFMDATSISNITTTKLITGPDTYDVIPFENQHRLLVSARDGIYQYDYSSMTNPQLLSKINVVGNPY